MKPLYILLAASLFFIASLQPARAWNAEGHMVISQYAYDHLRPEVKAACDALVAVPVFDVDSKTTNFITAAVWADDIKSSPYNVSTFSNWHFIDLPFSLDGTSTNSFVVPTDNVVWAISNCIVALQNPATSVSNQAVNLRFLLHFIGDIQQPLHSSTAISAAHPGGDSGGNSFNILGTFNNLHSLWDSGGTFLTDSITRPFTIASETTLSNKVAVVEAAYPYTASTGPIPNPMDWALEGWGLAQTVSYVGITAGSTPTSGYLATAAATTEQRMGIGGKRLADLLNAIYHQPSVLVVTNSSDSGAGILRQTVSDAYSGDTITFNSSLSGQTISLTSGAIVLNKNLSIDGSSLASGLQITGNHSSRIFTVSNGVTASLNSLVLTNGFADAGGAILNLGTLTINQCTLAGNSTSGGVTNNGGGIYNGGTLLVNECTLATNSAVSSSITLWTFETSQPATAGPFNAESGSGSASGSHAGAAVYSTPAGNGSSHSFSANTWAVGDYWQFSASTIGYSGIVVSWDQASSSTGPRDFTLQYSTDGISFTSFTNYMVLVNGTAPNPPWSATNGSAAYHFSIDFSGIPALGNAATVYFRLRDASTTSASGGTVAAGGTDRVDNFSIGVGGLGGGVYSTGTLTVNQSTLAGNIAAAGGGIEQASSTFNLTNSIVASNSLENIRGSFTGVANITSGDPLLAPLANNGGLTPTMLPQSGSPAIGAGNNAAAAGLSLDQRGLPRLVGTQVDIGAVEMQAALATTQPAFSLTPTSVILNGHLTTGELPANWYYEYGTTTSYGSFTGTNSQLLGNTNVQVTSAVSGLQPGTLYHFQLVATSSASTVVGGDMTFSTVPLYTLNTSSVSVPGSAGSSNVVLTVVPSSTAWTASPQASWLHFLGSNGSGTGSATVTFNFDANPGAMRTGLFFITGSGTNITVTVTQAVATVASPTLIGPTILPSGAFQFSFSGLTGTSFTVFATSNPDAPFNTWANLGPAIEIPANSGHFQFTDPQATVNRQHYYRIRSP